MDPREHPALRFNYLSTEQDRREWVEAVHCARRILTQPAFDELSGGELSPGKAVASDEEILEWVRRDAETALHPSCTCRMGTDDMSVVDPASMRVHGLDALRVVDASVMPHVTNGNIYAPTMMTAEKSADLIRGLTPLEPINEPFYRHQVRGSAQSNGGAAADHGLGLGPVLLFGIVPHLTVLVGIGEPHARGQLGRRAVPLFNAMHGIATGVRQRDCGFRLD